MSEVTIKKDETLKVTVEGLEDYPQEFSYQEWLEFVAQCIMRQSQAKRAQEENAKYAAQSNQQECSKYNAGIANPTTLGGGIRPRLGGGY